VHFLDDALLHEGDAGFLGVKLIRYSSDMMRMQMVMGDGAGWAAPSPIAARPASGAGASERRARLWVCLLVRRAGWGRRAVREDSRIPAAGRGLEQRQAHDAGVAAADLLDEQRGAALDAVGAGLVGGFAAGHVVADLVFVEARKRTWLTDSRARSAAVGDHHRGEHLVGAPGQARRISMACSPSSGLPMISPSSSRVVSAASSRRGGRLAPVHALDAALGLGRATRWT
jgi:hypothetical protein